MPLLKTVVLQLGTPQEYRGRAPQLQHWGLEMTLTIMAITSAVVVVKEGAWRLGGKSASIRHPRYRCSSWLRSEGFYEQRLKGGDAARLKVR